MEYSFLLLYFKIIINIIYITYKIDIFKYINDFFKIFKTFSEFFINMRNISQRVIRLKKY